VAVVAADFNGDGIPDLITINGNNPSDGLVSVLLGKGDGTFQIEQSYPVAASPRSVAVADLNGDGIPDIVVANRDSNTVSVLLGKGDGTIASGQTFALGSSPTAVVVADFNGDGAPDLALADGYGSAVRVLLNTTGAAPNSTISSPTANTYHVASWPGSISGTVTDYFGPGVASVGVSFFDGTHYWNGTAFSSNTPVYNTATLSGNTWTYAFPASNLTSGTTYTVQSKGVDTASHAETPGSGVAFLFASYTISGSVFYDINGDGIRNGSEPGEAGVTVYLDANNNGVLDPGEVSTTTDASGNFSFTDLLPGTYNVREVVPPSSTQTAPSGGAFVVNLTASSSGYAFGNVPPPVTGTVYVDANDNGVLDNGEVRQAWC
jgi:hypothetical protein